MSLSRETVKQDIKYYKRDFWSTENLKFSTPHYRMRKSARIVNKIAKDRTCELLDVGCGPATLRRLIRDDIRYYGVDIAIHEPPHICSSTTSLIGPSVSRTSPSISSWRRASSST